MFSNWQYRLLAVVLAVLCWYLVTGRDVVETWVEIPVELVQSNPDLMIRSGLETKIKARIRGPKAMVRALDPKTLAYPLDFSSLEPGSNIITFSPGNVALPGALAVVEINPTRMELQVDRVVTKSVEVSPVLDVHVDPDYELRNAVCKPVTVDVRGPEQVIKEMTKAETRLISVNATKPDMMVYDVGMDLPDDVESDPKEVRVDLYFGEKTKDVWVETPVRTVPDGLTDVRVSPEKVKLHLTAPVSMLRQSDFRRQVTATLVVPSDLEPGRHSLAFRVKLPDGCTLIKAVPAEVDVRKK